MKEGKEWKTVMSKKILVFLSITFILLITLASVFYIKTFGNPLKILHYEQETKVYLLEKGFQEQDISSIKGSYDWVKDSGYNIVVVFLDEPSGEYRFRISKNDGAFYLVGASRADAAEPKHLKRLSVSKE